MVSSASSTSRTGRATRTRATRPASRPATPTSSSSTSGREASEARYDDVLDHLGDLDVDVARVRSARGWVDADVVFGVGGALAQALTEPSRGHGHGAANCHGSHQREVEVLSVELPGAGAVSTAKLLRLLGAAPKDEAYRIKAVVMLSAPPANSDPDAPPPQPQPRGRYILNWAFGRWTFAPVADAQSEHASTDGAALCMTMILGRHESAKWKKRLEAGGFLELEGPEKGELSVKRVL